MGKLDDVQVHLIESFAEAEAFMRWLGERRTCLGIDTETGGLEFWREPLRLVQIGDGQQGWSMAWDRWAGVAEEVLTKYEDAPIVMHNAKFDVQFFEQNGVQVPRRRVHDTMLMAHILDGTQSVALKSLAARLVDPRAGAGQQALALAMRTQGWTWRTVPVDFEMYWAYGALDAVETALLYEHLEPQVRAGGFEYAYELERACLWVLADMEKRGTRIDVAYCEQKLKEAKFWIEQAVLWCRETYGIENPFSNQQLAQALLNAGVQLTKRTKTGKYKLDEDILKSIDHPLTNTILMMRKVDKKADSYFRNFIDMRDGDLLHPSIKPVGARTSRMSITAPALQTLPREAVVRDAFIARDGNKLLLSDFDQIEMRVFAHLTRDPDLIGAFAEGDFFTNIARELYHDPSLVKRDPRRQMTKNGMYALGYGAGAPKIAATVGAPVQEVQDFLNRLNTRFPGIHTFQRQVDNVARERFMNDGVAWVRTMFGRRHTAEYDKTYRLVNYLIQGTCAEVLKLKIVELDAAGYGEWMVLPVHDEVVMDIPEEHVAQAVEEVPRIMAETERFAVPLTVGTDVCDRWGEKYRDPVAQLSKQSGDHGVENL